MEIRTDEGMVIEPERRFMVERGMLEGWRTMEPVKRIEQVYLGESGEWSIRSRKIERSDANVKYLLTMKKPHSHGTSYEIEVPGTRKGHEQIFKHSGKRLRKRRYVVDIGSGLKAEVDDFSDSGIDLLVAEVELASIDQAFEVPYWFGREITGEQEWSNARIFERLSPSDD